MNKWIKKIIFILLIIISPLFSISIIYGDTLRNVMMSAKEGGQGDRLTHGYNDIVVSRNLINFSQSPDVFRGKMPKILRKVANMEIPRWMTNKEAINTIEQMQRGAKDLLEKGPELLLMLIYSDYAKTHGLEEEVEIANLKLTLTLPKPIAKLSREERYFWETYIDTTELSRGIVVEAVCRLLGLLNIPSVKYIDDITVRFFHQAFLRAEYEICLVFLPDIRDEEAKKIFGQLTSAQDVHSIANRDICEMTDIALLDELRAAI